MIAASQGATDPAAWAQAVQSVGPDRGVILVVVVGALLALLFWRGAEKLGVIGVGQELRLMRVALEKNASEQTALRGDFHVIVQWLAKRERTDPPPLAPLSESEAAAAPLAPPPSHDPPTLAPTSRRPREQSSSR
jgi:hypothetical protein